MSLKIYSHPAQNTSKKIGLLSNLNKEKFHKILRQIEDQDKIAFYKAPHSYNSMPFPGSIESKPRSSQDPGPSKESVEYHVIPSYEIGSLGLAPSKRGFELEGNLKVRPKHSPRRKRKRMVKYDDVAATILSDMGLLSRFVKTGRDVLLLRKRVVRQRRVFYHC